jgi:peptidoglycan L-alanyl-D-glutamate endopeptidase CwlK
MNAVIVEFDDSIIWGHRGQSAQNAAFDEGYSKKRWQESLHNFYPAFAVDAVPYPEMWEVRDRLVLHAGYVMGIAKGLDVPLIWGGDWNRNWIIRDERFEDLAHFQLDVRALGVDLEKHRTREGWGLV